MRICRMTNARRSLALVLTLSLVVGACADAPTSPTGSPASSPAISTPVDAQGAAAQGVALGLALAMGDVSIRKQVHAAMRASRLNEHKLVLQDLLNTAGGKKILSAAAARLNVTPASLQRTIANLPRLDFYAPFAAHRLNWRASSDVYVAVTFDGDAPTIVGYGTNGRTVTLSKDQGVPEVPLLILHPAEPTQTRTAPQANTPGDVIQELRDGKRGLQNTEVCEPYLKSPAAPSLVTQSLFGETGSGPMSVCEPGGGGNPPPPPPPTPGVYLNYMNIQEGDGWFGNSEIQIRSFAIRNFEGWHWEGTHYTSNSIVAELCPLGISYQNEVEEDRGYDFLVLLSAGVTNVANVTCDGQAAYYGIHIWEMDGGMNGGDDDFGWRIYASPPGCPEPWCAAVNTVNTHYLETFSLHEDARRRGWEVPQTKSGYLRIQYR